MEVDSSRVVLTGTNVAGLLQGVYWLQDRMESAGGPFLPKGRTNRTALLIAAVSLLLLCALR